jgi:hypothetical protein
VEAAAADIDGSDLGTQERGSPRPFRHHALGLLLLLAALVPLIGTDSAFVTDESYVVIQLDTIEHTGAWTLPHPIPEVDPTGKAFPIHGGTRYEDGYTLYGKHPALIYLYLPVHRAFGLVGLVALSVLGTWAAAVFAARLAGRIRPGSERVALWLVGVASPLFFDAFLIHAHSIGAALAAGASLLALRHLEERRVVFGVLAVLAVLALALVRSEGVLFAGALGGAIGLQGLLRRRVGSVLVGAASMAAGAGALLLDRKWAGIVAGSDAIAAGRYAEPARSFLEGRRVSATNTLLMAGYRGGSMAEAVTLLGAVLLIAGAIIVRRRPTDDGALLLPFGGALLLVVRVGLEWGPIPGLLLAFCVGVVGLVLLGGAVGRSRTTRFLLLASGAYAIAVAATQYPGGGHTEWGGRYFALAIPLFGAVAAASLHPASAAWPPRTEKVMRGALVAAGVSLAALAVITLHATHERNRERTDGVLAAAAAMGGNDGAAPVIVTEDEQVPRLARGRYAEARFLRVPSREIGPYLSRLAAEGVEDVLLVAGDPERSLARVPAAYEQVGGIAPHKLQWEGEGGLIRLHLRPESNIRS